MLTSGLAVHLIVVARRPSQSIVQHALASQQQLLQHRRTKYMHLARASAAHPDKNSSLEAQTKLQAINEAWAVLKNKSTRILYDRDGKKGLPDGIISTDDEDEDDNDADDGGATKLPHVYSFFGSATQAPGRPPMMRNGSFP
jgi:DnaJ-class molecular chaperone